MSTKLEKDIIRESTVIVNDRNVVVTLSADQKIKFKLKGMKSGELEISIQDLYDKLGGKNVEPSVVLPMSSGPVVIDQNKKTTVTDKHLFSLNDFRSAYLVSTDFDLGTKVKLEALTVQLLKK
jgi:hypothetical protein